MKTVLQIERPYVHGAVQLSWVEPTPRVHVFSDALTVNAVPVIIEGVLVREGDVWRFESFALQRAVRAPNGHGNGRGCAYWSTSRRNQERAREVILDVVSKWAAGRPQETQAPRCVPAPGDGSAVIAELLTV